MNLFLEPVDVLYFRDSKPFSRGDEHYAKSIFPPYGTTLYGSIRTMLIDNSRYSFEDFYSGNIEDKKFAEVIGTPEETGELFLKGIFLYSDVLYFKAPLDLVKINDEYQVLKLHKVYAGTKLSNGFDMIPFISDNETESLENSYLSIGNLANYLYGNIKISTDGIKTEPEIISRDKRFGIGIDNKINTVKEGQLFIAESVELNEGWRLSVLLNDSEYISNKGYLRLGGGSRPVHYRKDNKDLFSIIDINKIKNKIKEKKRFKIIFISPAVMKNDWKHSMIDSDNVCDVDGVRLKLVSALIGKPSKIGGYDMAKRVPKPMYNVLPPGTIYYMEFLDDVTDDMIEKVFNKFYLKNNSDIYQNMGFGLTILGGVAI